MITFPNCKINLGLNILRKREDNFHDLETIFFPIHFTDVLEVIYTSGPFHFQTSGLSIDNNENNLCLKAYELIKNDFPTLPAITMHLHKAIPMGAGLGGGSADAACTLKLLIDKFNLSVSEEQLNGYALQLGSDCPFFLINKPCFAEGRGEKLTPINIDLKGYKLLLVNPGIHINTASAFSKIDPHSPSKNIKDIISQPIDTWKDNLVNDFEGPVFSEHPQIKEIKEDLYKQGAIYVSMSGSGSTVYGLFKNEIPSGLLANNQYFHKTIEIR
jgi:4-diphosphocytidyl-2-C-methyl-D-erythritol kinase